MGRTIPSFRSELELYVGKLRRVASLIQDGERRRALEELLEHAYDLENEFSAVCGTPEEQVLLSMLLHLYTKRGVGRPLRDRGVGPNE